MGRAAAAVGNRSLRGAAAALAAPLCRIHYTPALRANDVGVMTLGQMQLDIPPGEQRCCAQWATSAIQPLNGGMAVPLRVQYHVAGRFKQSLATG